MDKKIFHAQDRGNAIEIDHDKKRISRRREALRSDRYTALGGIIAAFSVEGLNRFAITMTGEAALGGWSFWIIVLTIVYLLLVGPIRKLLWSEEDEIFESEKPKG